VEQLSFPQDLLETAQHLSRLDPGTEAGFRRSVSTAYYALFHLIIDTACENWPEPQRGRVARQFDHKRMRDASSDILKRLSSEASEVHAGLVELCRTFVRLQDQRHAADYDLNAIVGPGEATMNAAAAETAFEIREQIKRDPLVHDYLFSLLFKDRA
jgi:uncharacterized protein (UPF0332 family)